MLNDIVLDFKFMITTYKYRDKSFNGFKNMFVHYLCKKNNTHEFNNICKKYTFRYDQTPEETIGFMKIYRFRNEKMTFLEYR